MFAWEDQVARDHQAKRQAVALRVVTLLRREVGRLVSGVAVVEQQWLANEIGVSRRGVQKALSWLQKRGHLKIYSRKHLRRPNFYEPVVVPIRTRVRIEIRKSELQFAVDANATAQNAGLAVRTNTDTPSNYSGVREVRRRERGKYELQLVERLGLGADGLDVLAMLTDRERALLCLRQQLGAVSDEEIAELRLRYRHGHAIGASG
jgi:hypothetical protein